jgi:hypothetical protein
MDVLKRIKANTIEKRLLNANGDPNFGINFYILKATGEHAAVTMYAGVPPRVSRCAVCDENGPRAVECEALFPGRPMMD